MKSIVRFAPSPTGYIHIGNVRTALYNWILAHNNGGQFILRFDDTDKSRTKQEFADGIESDLNWMGIIPDRVEFQSKRTDLYDKVAQDLKSKGLLYPCYETSDELDRRRKRQRARGLPPVYDRTGYWQSEEERQKLKDSGRKPHWRFLLPNYNENPEESVPTNVEWVDLCRGTQSIDLASMSDPVLIREDGSYLYTLPSIIDDMDMGVTDIVRGEDHVANTSVQIAIFKALGGDVPKFAHHNLLTSKGGEGLSKRNEVLSIESLREKGIEPQSVVAMAGLIGTSYPVEPISSLQELAKSFEFDKISRSPAQFDPSELENLNQKVLHSMPYSQVRQRLVKLEVDHGEEFWDIAKENISQFGEIKSWSEILFGTIETSIESEDCEFIQIARKLLPVEPWDESTWQVWTNAVKEKTGRSGKLLFMPLRRALTGRDHGPELKKLLPLIGYDRSYNRLNKV